MNESQNNTPCITDMEGFPNVLGNRWHFFDLHAHAWLCMMAELTPTT